MKDRPFKVGDVVVCVDPPSGFKRGGIYKIIGVYDDERIVVDGYHKGYYHKGYYHWRFELASKPTLLKKYFGLCLR